MKAAVIGDEISQDLTEVIQLAIKHRFQGVEIRSVWGKAPHELDRSECQRIRSTIEAAGLEIVGFASPALKTSIPENEKQLRACQEVLEQSLLRAQWLGAPIMRIFSFYHASEPNAESAASVMKLLLAGIKDESVDLVVETGTSSNTPNAECMQRLLNEIGDQELGVLWDPGNTIFSGFAIGSPLAEYELLHSRIRHIHVKDPKDRSHYDKLGSGSLPWMAILEALHRDRYTGFVSLETHWRKDHILTREERNQPWGHRISAGGYEASDECMEILSKMLTSVRSKFEHSRNA